MIRNFCDKCNKEISLEHNCEISSKGFEIDPMKPGAGEFHIYLDLCNECHKQIHNIIMNWKHKKEYK